MVRYLASHLIHDLARKMVFLAGPRQVGKTTLAKTLLAAKKNYLNWDSDDGRTLILDKEFPATGLVVFDELHKFKKWRGYLKGIYDTKSPALQILVTGSAKLDLYRYGGDSLQGRYHFWRLHPLSVAELKISSNRDLESLLNLGGFPEPFLEGSEKFARRWSREYRARIVRDDISSIESVTDLASMEILLSQLRLTVGSPLSINSLREQLQVSHATVTNWLNIFERMYGYFRLSPLGAPKIRAVKKEQKGYLFDWSIIPEEGPRFENLVAVHLQKYVHFLQDSEGIDLELRYYRDTTPREVDFVIVRDGKPWKAIECKVAEHSINPHLFYFKSKFPQCECFQIYYKGQKDYVSPEGVRLLSAQTFLRDLI